MALVVLAISANKVSLSANGLLVAFSSGATNLVAGDNNDVGDVFVHNLKTGLTQRISVDSEEIESNGYSFYPSLSASGLLVAFSSNATNLVSGDNNNASDVFVRNLRTGVTQRVSVGTDGSEGNGSSGENGPYISSYNVAISANGRFVAFVSYASNLVPNDTNGLQDVFVRDLKTEVTERVSVSSTGEEASISGYDPFKYCAGAWFSISSGSPSLSADGRFVAFDSDACNLVEGDTNNGFYSVGYDYPGTDIFIHDRKTGETKLASIDSSGVQVGLSYDPSISSNGRYVAFTSYYGGELNLYYYLMLRSPQSLKFGISLAGCFYIELGP
jgi:Tol biopolymer transport system component